MLRNRFYLLFALVACSATVLSAGTTQGPDVIVQTLGSTSNYGTAEIGGIDYIGYSVGTTSCNIGSEPVWWCDHTINGVCDDSQHPVIGQNLYRLKNDRFTQVGMSWLKHGFLSTNSGGNSSGCGAGTCVGPPQGGDQLGIGCLDTYGSGLNGGRPLGLRSEVNATTGIFPFPETAVATSTAVDQRVRVKVEDVEPALNAGATYWVEGQYVTADDAQAGLGLNNASYRRVTVSSGSLSLSRLGDYRGSRGLRAGNRLRARVCLHASRILAPRRRSSPGRRLPASRQHRCPGGGRAQSRSGSTGIVRRATAP